MNICPVGGKLVDLIDIKACWGVLGFFPLSKKSVLLDTNCACFHPYYEFHYPLPPSYTPLHNFNPYIYPLTFSPNQTESLLRFFNSRLSECHFPIFLVQNSPTLPAQHPCLQLHSLSLPISFHVYPTLSVSLFPSHTLQQVELQCGQPEFQFHLQRKSFSVEVPGMDKSSQESICQILLLSYKYFWHSFRDLWFSQIWGRFLGGESPWSTGKLEFNCCVNAPIKVQLGSWLKQSSLHPAAKLSCHAPASCVLQSQTMFPVCSTWRERS